MDRKIGINASAYQGATISENIAHPVVKGFTGIFTGYKDKAAEE